MNKNSTLKSIFTFKCPKCHEGDFFQSGIYDLKKVGDLHEQCPKCGLNYEPEPGFYYGAMYVAYALGVALFVSIWVSFILFIPSASVWWQIGTIIFATVALGPYLYALSKIIWANFFMHYDQKAIQRDKQSTH
jgi:uncharacterized protein (DUF983 family)